jgi:glycosyltransferase domain-containing protein
MNLTIIILTIDNREKLLNRAIEYYKDFKAKIIIVDGGYKSKKFKKSKKIKYYKLPGVSFDNRLKFALQNSKSSYVINSQDDDFTNLQLVKKGLRLLKKNKKISWVGGNQIFFREYFGLFIFKKIKNQFIDKDYLSENSIKRFAFFFKNQPQLYASLFRRKKLIKSLDDYSKLNRNKKVFNSFELPFSLLMSSYGTYHHFDDIWQFRDGYSNSNSMNDHKNYILRLVNNVPKNVYKNSKELKIIKNFFFKKLKKKIPKNTFNKLINNLVDQRYEQDKKHDQYNTYNLLIKIFLKKNLKYIFNIFKKLNYFLSFFYYFLINMLSEDIKTFKTSNSWFKIKTILKKN